MSNKEKAPLVPKLRFPEFLNAEGWTQKELCDCLDYLQPTQYLVNSTAYNDIYEIPVVTAGKTFILGYTDETEGVFEQPLPVIIFDDFTTASQYVDFRFKAKSSAMKILLAKQDINIKFIYESMQKIDYEVGAHGRHWISAYSKVKVAVPKPNEQQKIADCLSSLDELIAAQARKVDALKTHKKGLMQQLFPCEGETQPRLRFPEFRDAGQWEAGPISQFAEINPRREVRPDEVEVSFVPMNAVSENGFLAIQQTRKYGAVKKGFTAFRDCDVILAKITPCFENGKAALVRALENGVGFGSTEFHVIRAQKSCLPEFIFAQLYSDQFRSLGKASMTGTGGHQRVPASFVEDYVICVPGLPEQQRIADSLTSLDDLITAQTQELETLKTHKKGLMQQLFPSAEAVEA